MSAAQWIGAVTFVALAIICGWIVASATARRHGTDPACRVLGHCFRGWPVNANPLPMACCSHCGKEF